MIVWPEIARLIDAHGAAALVTLAEAQGSSPREPGARMVVAPDGRFTGTIGGGALEWGALAEAQVLLADRSGASVRQLDRALGPDLGQCCGGRVTLLIERFGSDDRASIEQLADAERSGEVVTLARPDAKGRFHRRIASADGRRLEPEELCRRLDDGTLLERFGDPRTPLFLFGAGHVGTALTAALAPLPFAVTWIDPRAGAFPDHVAPNVRCAADGNPVRFIADAPAGAFIAVMTHSHALDLDLVIAALQAERFPYVGLIGSDTKRARFVSAMRKMDVPGIDRLVCPIGLPGIRDKAPAAIAAAVVAQLLIEREAQTDSASHAPHRHEDEQRGGRRA